MAQILVIDDDLVTRILLQRLLEQDGHDVTAVESGEEGFAHYHAHRSDLVITDLIMPGMSGLDVIEALREEFEDAKIIGISAGAKDFPPVKRMQGADHVFSKPIDREILLRVVNRLLSTKNAP